MKYKKILVTIILIIFCLNSNVMALEPKEVYYLYQHQIKFTDFEYNENYYHIEYFTEFDEGQEQLFIGLKKDSEEGHWLNYYFQIQQSGYNTGYFYIEEINSYNAGVVAFRYWDGTKWKNRSGLINIPASKVIDYGDPPGDSSPQNYLKGRLEITEPPYNGYKVNREDYWLQYRYGVPLLVQAPPGAVITGVTTYAGTHEVHSWYVDESGEEDIVYKYYRVKIKLQPGINTITATLNYGGKTYTDTKTIEYLTGVVDENNDGIDDRTGLPINPPDSGISPGNGPMLPSEPTIFDYVKYAVDSIIYLFAQVGIMLKSVLGSTGEIGQILNTFFSFMPAPFTAIILIGIFIAIILRVLGR